MKSKREAKRILRAFGREEGKARIRYVDSFLPEKTSFIGSISYRHMLRRAAIVVVLMAMIMALAVSAYAAVMHYLNYRKIEHQDNDEYLPIDDNAYQHETYDDISFLEPTYIPDDFSLKSEECDEVFKEKTWYYSGTHGKTLEIMEYPAVWGFHVDNERGTLSKETIEDTEVIIYSFSGGVAGFFQMSYFQYERMLISIAGDISIDELRMVIEGIIP